MALATDESTSAKKPDKAWRIPLFAQVRDQLRREILDGEFQPGDAIPPEPQLCRRFGVSRITLRHSVDDLVREGLLDKLPGKGTFVRASQYETSLMSLGGFGHNASSFRNRPRRKVLRKFTQSLDSVRAKRLGVSEGTKAYGLERLLLDGDEILAMDTTRYPCDLVPGFPDLIDDMTSTFDVLQTHYGLKPCGTTGELRIGYASLKEAENLRCETNEPIINIDKIIMTTGHQPVALSELALRPHHVNVHFEYDS